MGELVVSVWAGRGRGGVGSECVGGEGRWGACFSS